MNRVKLVMVSALFLASVCCGAAQAFEGPLQVRNQFPLFMHTAAPALESAKTAGGFTAGFSYSSVFMSKKSEDWTVLLDMEIAALELQYKRVVGNNLELGVRLPFISFGSGFLDSALNDFHSAVGLPDYGRSEWPDNVFAYEVRQNGQLMIRGEAGAGLGDISFSAKKGLLAGDPSVSVMGWLELPTGDAGRGYGNASIDAGLSVLVDKMLGDKVKSYYNAGIIFPGDIKDEQTVELRESFYGGAGLEYLVSPYFGLLAQAVFQTSPFPKTGIDNIDREGVLLSMGGRYAGDKDSFEVSLTEDLTTAGAPDFTVNITYQRRF